MKFGNSCVKRRPALLVFSLAVILTAAILISCGDDPSCPDDSDEIQYVWETRRIKDTDYIFNTYFFLDHPNGPFILPSLDPGLASEGVEVFVSVTPYEITQHPEWVVYPEGKAFVDSLATGADIQAAIDEFYRDGVVTSSHFEGDFRRLEFGADFYYLLDQVTDEVIAIVLARRVDNFHALAVRYVNTHGDTIGNYGQLADHVGFLELIKPQDPRPDDEFGYTWPFVLRSMYNLGFTDIGGDHLEIAIEDKTNRTDRTRPEGETVPYLRIFGLDRFDQNGSPEPDDRIDLVESVIDLTRGILMFPSLRAFDPLVLCKQGSYYCVAEWCQNDLDFVVPDDYTGLENPVIYDEHLNASELILANKYDIVVKVRREK